MTSIWDDPEMKVVDDWIKFENPGDTAEGTIVSIRPHRFDDGTTAPELILALAGGEERSLTAGQIRLKAALAEQRPEPGDHIFIQFTKVEPRGGGKTLKHFDVVVTRAGQAPKVSGDPAATAALAALTEEQRKAIGF